MFRFCLAMIRASFNRQPASFSRCWLYAHAVSLKAKANPGARTNRDLKKRAGSVVPRVKDPRPMPDRKLKVSILFSLVSCTLQRQRLCYLGASHIIYHMIMGGMETCYIWLFATTRSRDVHKNDYWTCARFLGLLMCFSKIINSGVVVCL